MAGGLQQPRMKSADPVLRAQYKGRLTEGYIAFAEGAGEYRPDDWIRRITAFMHPSGRVRTVEMHLVLAGGSQRELTTEGDFPTPQEAAAHLKRYGVTLGPRRELGSACETLGIKV